MRESDRHGPLHRALDGVFATCEFELRTNSFGNIEVVLSEGAARRLAALIETAPVVPPAEAPEEAPDILDEDYMDPPGDADPRPVGWGQLL